ncbi:MAG: hypothetical protein JJ975_00745 [Bacteroidia bacterium]|nr:hypothetical protein [Bacteroidia bacterium]
MKRSLFAVGLLVLMVFIGCDEDPTGDPVGEVTHNAIFTESGGKGTVLKSKNAKGERYSNPDRFLVFATNGASKWEVFALTEESTFLSDDNRSFTYIPDTTDLSVVYSARPGRVTITTSNFNADTTQMSVRIEGTAHNSNTDSVNFVSDFITVPVSK